MAIWIKCHAWQRGTDISKDSGNDLDNCNTETDAKDLCFFVTCCRADFPAVDGWRGLVNMAWVGWELSTLDR